jgi:glyoxylase-like metal-dependent hydrolase (beta-lactamase superfamily II)
MDGETELAPGVTAFPTPGHMSLLIASRNERALLVGDILGSPVQATETDFHYSPRTWTARWALQPDATYSIGPSGRGHW